MQLVIPKCRDANGHFQIEMPGVCGVHGCGKHVDAVVKYTHWQSDVPVKSTILKLVASRVGIPCGCYAKLNRQVAHIAGPRSGKRT